MVLKPDLFLRSQLFWNFSMFTRFRGEPIEMTEHSKHTKNDATNRR